MDNYVSLSQPLIDNSRNFLTIKKTTLFKSIYYFFSSTPVVFVGWGRKRSGLWAEKMAKLTKNRFLLLEDGLIRSLGLGVEGSPSFSMVQDNVGIYYDATTPSRLENILNSHNFKDDSVLMAMAKEARVKIVEHKISKYNHFKAVNLDYLNDGEEKVLIVAQTDGDSSLRYGLGNSFSTQKMIDDAINDNPNVKVYIKIHPDVLSGKKKSDISPDTIPQTCHILTDNANPIALLKYFDKVYTKTSGMGFEALLLNKKVHCYGLPFYAGWGVTIDKIESPRRQRILTVDEIFASSYILYTTYYDPYINKKMNLLETIESIVSYQEINVNFGYNS